MLLKSSAGHERFTAPLFALFSLSPSVSDGGRGLFAACSSSIVLTCFCLGLGCNTFRVTGGSEHTRRFKVGGAGCSPVLLSRLLFPPLVIRVSVAFPRPPTGLPALTSDPGQQQPPPTARMFSLDCGALCKPQSCWRCCGNPSRLEVSFHPCSDARFQPQLVVFSRCLLSPQWLLPQMSLNNRKKKCVGSLIWAKEKKRKMRLRLTPCFNSKYIFWATQELHSCKSEKQ